MPTVTFKKGIHPPQSKETSDKPIRVVEPRKGDIFIYPMSQHIGAPCEPAVAKGDRVFWGQKIGDSAAFVSSPVYATVSGVVTDIRPAVTPTGITSNAVFVENDGEKREHPDLNKPVDYKTVSREALIKTIREAGIVGLGGAGFPTHVKLSPPPDKKIDTVIVNAAECEPYLTTDHRVLLEETDRILLGLRVLLHLFPGARGMIGVETNKADAIEKLREKNQDENIAVIPLQPKYPQGAEKQLIKACTGREVPSGGLPADIGCIVQNVDTVIAIHRAIFRGRPLMRKVVTVAGGCAKNPGNYKVMLGMRYADFIDAIGGMTEQPYKMISGGPMMGVSMFTLDVPVIKTSSAVLLLTEEEAKLPPERGCIRCGRCVDHCPSGLMPLDLNRFAVHGERDLFRKQNGLDCIECGSCSYVCPAKRHLAQSIRAMRREELSKR
ncbi:MAG: electron transport complex subunit RsxC [Clostridiales bacterium]|jgi:electron transport complex protein RnfC|nr:electron transport complex subunit RsxC [Clostridiales bacterium]